MVTARMPRPARSKKPSPGVFAGSTAAIDGTESFFAASSTLPEDAVLVPVAVPPVTDSMRKPDDTVESRLTVESAPYPPRFCAVTVQVVNAPTVSAVGSHDWVRVTAPWVSFQATGIRTEVCRSERNTIAPKYRPLSAVEVTVTLKVWVPPGLIQPLFGDTLIFEPAGAVVPT